MIDKLRKKIGKEILENEPLAKHCTFKIGGPARFFFVAKNSDEIVQAVKAAAELKLPFFIFGDGSNVLFSDNGFDGLVLKIQNTKYKIQDTKIETEAGVKLAEIVNAAAENGLSGLEWAVGIPGTVGGAVRGNAGAYGKAMNDVLEEVEALQFENQESRIKNYKKNECKFGYRESVFKHNKDIILKVVLRLAPGDKNKIKEEMEKVLKARSEKIPTEASAGSFFKNVKATDEIVKTIKEYTHEDVLEDFIKKGKIPAGWLIDQCDLRGKQIGGAKISEKHANFIVNIGEAKAADVIALASLIKMKVRDEVGVQLQEEVEYVSF